MLAPMSLDLRLRIVRAVERGSSIRQAARRFAVSPSAAIKLMQRVRRRGSPAPSRLGGHRRRLLAPHEGDLRRLVAATPDHTLAELRADSSAAAASKRGSRRSPTRSAGSACGLKKSLKAAEQDRPDVAHQRRRWRGWQRFMDASRFVFLDETGTATNLVRRYGRSPAR